MNTENQKHENSSNNKNFRDSQKNQKTQEAAPPHDSKKSKKYKLPEEMDYSKDHFKSVMLTNKDLIQELATLSKYDELYLDADNCKNTCDYNTIKDIHTISNCVNIAIEVYLKFILNHNKRHTEENEPDLPNTNK